MAGEVALVMLFQESRAMILRHAWRRFFALTDWRVFPLLALVIVAAATSYGYHRLLLAQRDSIEHTYQVMSALESTLQLMTDAETGQRGFILTENKSYLAPYFLAVDRVHALPRRLRQLVSDSPTQLARLSALESALDDKLAELEHTLRVANRDGVEAARKLIRNDIGRERMDRVRDLIAQMRNAETDLLLERTGHAAHTERTMLTVTILLAMVSIATRVGLHVVFQKSRERKVANEDHKRAPADDASKP